MILIGIGANLESRQYGVPRAACGAALETLAAAELSVAARSRWYRSAPVPVSDQPWFVNAVVHVRTALDPGRLMDLLIATEIKFGRQRGEANAARVLDLDLLAYGEVVLETAPSERAPQGVRIPHPRLHERAFVLLPLRDIAPRWRHPETGLGLDDMVAALGDGQEIEAMDDGGGVYGTEWKDIGRLLGPGAGTAPDAT